MWKNMKKIEKKFFTLFQVFSFEKGFSLVELIVVVGIVALLSISSVVGFGYLGDTLKVREVTGVMADTIAQEELKVLRGDFEKVTIHFFKDYMVVDEQAEDATLTLTLEGDYASGHEIRSSDSGNLAQTDEEGSILQIKSVSGSDLEPIPFKEEDDVAEIEWSYQLTSVSDLSNIIRFIHFNLQRENLNNPIFIIGNADSKIEITAPYGKKTVYSSSGSQVDSVELTIQDENGNSEAFLTLQ